MKGKQRPWKCGVCILRFPEGCGNLGQENILQIERLRNMKLGGELIFSVAVVTYFQVCLCVTSVNVWSMDIE